MRNNLNGFALPECFPTALVRLSASALVLLLDVVR